jgi:hypothetical protein
VAAAGVRRHGQLPARAAGVRERHAQEVRPRLRGGAPRPAPRSTAARAGGPGCLRGR